MAAADVLRALNARIDELKQEVVVSVEAKLEAKLMTLFRTHRTSRDGEIQRLFNVLFSREQAHIDKHFAELEKSFGNRVTAAADLPADPFPTSCDAQSAFAICADIAISNFELHKHHDRFARAELYCVRILRSKSNAPLSCAATPNDVTRFLCCEPGIIEHVEEMRANGKGKPRMLVYFTSGVTAAAAFHAFKASSPNSSKADLTYKQTNFQNMLVNLAIQLQKVARDTGLTDASFLARGDTIVFKEGPTAATKAYPFIKHFWKGNPPRRGEPFNNVNATAVNKLISPLLTPRNPPPPPQRLQQQQEQQQQRPQATRYPSQQQSTPPSARPTHNQQRNTPPPMRSNPLFHQQQQQQQQTIPFKLHTPQHMQQQRSSLSYAAAAKQPSPHAAAAAAAKQPSPHAAAAAAAKQPSQHAAAAAAKQSSPNQAAAAAAAAKHHSSCQTTSHRQEQPPAPPPRTTPKPVRSQHTPHKRRAVSPGSATNTSSPTHSMPPPRTTGLPAKKTPSAPSTRVQHALAEAAQTDRHVRDQSTNQ